MEHAHADARDVAEGHERDPPHGRREVLLEARGVCRRAERPPKALEPQLPEVRADEHEREHARDTLEEMRTITRVVMRPRIGAQREMDPEEAVEEEREEHETELQDPEERDPVHGDELRVVGRSRREDGGARPEVQDEEHADREHPREAEPPPQLRPRALHRPSFGPLGRLTADLDRTKARYHVGVYRVRVSSFAFVAAAAVAAAGVGACSRSGQRNRPVATLSTSPAAATAFAKLHDRWETGKMDTHAPNEFIRRYPDDGAVPLAKVYLAFALIDTGDLINADGVLASLSELRPGATRDLAMVARARSLRLHGAPQSALDNLRPLVGKVVDEGDREVFLEELALSAIGAHDDYEALAYLDAWLRGVGEDDRERVKTKIAQILDTLPRQVLEQTYRSMRERGAASGYTPDTQKLVATRLAHIAVETNDAALARWLLDVSGTSAAQAGGDAGLELGELAASRRGLSIVTGRTVGLLFPTRELRDEAAEVVRGVSWALDLPRRTAALDGVRLVTREDGIDEAGTRAAMEELAGDGAAIIVAGFDRASADRASLWAEQTGMPVLLLAAPSHARMPKTNGFVLGERTEREIAMLADALVRHGTKTAALVVDAADDEAASSVAEGRNGLVLLPPTRCDIPLAEAGKTRFPVAAWITSGAQGWLVSGPSSCARDVLRDVRKAADARRTAPRAFAVTLEAGVPPSEIPPGVVVLSASAGLVPVLATTPEEAREEDVKEYMRRIGTRPTYWAAIGRDAGVLARAALSPLPNDTTNDPKAVIQRRAIVSAGISAARTRLWTTDDKGFDGARVLPRALRLATINAPK